MSVHGEPRNPVLCGCPVKWLITGAAGFIGSHLAHHLISTGHSVIGIDNFDRFYARAMKEQNLARIHTVVESQTNGRNTSHVDGSSRFQLIEGDILDRSLVMRVVEEHQPDMITHIAALAGVRPSLADPLRYMRVNVEGLTNVLNAARAVRSSSKSRCGGGGVLFASSSSVYGNNAKAPFSETDAVDEPISPYAASKRAGELVCQAYARVYGLRIAALRFFTVFGPAQRPDLAISKFMRKIALGEPIEMFGNGTTQRDYTYIDDIVSGILSAGEAVRAERAAAQAGEVVGGGYFRIYNLGGSKPHTLSDMIDAIARIVDRPAKIIRKPMQPGDVDRTWADLARSQRELGFAPRTSFEEGLKQQWNWLEKSLSVRT